MKNLKTFGLLAMGLMLSLLTACGEDNEPILNPENPEDVNLTGEWLLSTGTDSEWMTYEFSSGMTVTAESYSNGFVNEASGNYFKNPDGTLDIAMRFSSSQMLNQQWRILLVKPFQIDIENYTAGQLSGEYSLYSIRDTMTISSSSVTTPEYKYLVANRECSQFRSLDEDIVKVDEATGEIEAVGEGKTFIVFYTSEGFAAIRVIVKNEYDSVAEYLLGSWVVDEQETWEKDNFGPNGYYYAQWSRGGIFPTSDESAQGTYEVNEQSRSVNVVATTALNQRLSYEVRISDQKSFSFHGDVYNSGSKTAEFTYRRIIATTQINVNDTYAPDYSLLVPNTKIISYKSHDSSVASVDADGTIKGIAPGLTYIDVVTQAGEGVVEVTVDSNVMPFNFAKWLEADASTIIKLAGMKATSQSATLLLFNNPSPVIDYIGVSMDDWSERSYGLNIQYAKGVNVDDITTILGAQYIPFAAGTQGNVKAYMNASTTNDATIGVTWDTEKRTLVYVSLPQTLFHDYGLLLDKTRAQVRKKMGANPTTQNDVTYIYVNPEKNVDTVSIAWKTKNESRSYGVIVDLAASLTPEQMKSYFGRKYILFPDMSTQDEYCYLAKDQSVWVFYDFKNNRVTYLSVDNYLE